MSSHLLTENTVNTAYSIGGMTCETCVKTITEKVLDITDVKSVNVSLVNKKINILSNRKIELKEVRLALSQNPKYHVNELQAQPLLKTTAIDSSEKTSTIKTYKPLITVFAFVLLISLVIQIGNDKFDGHLFMNHIMAGFFIGLSYFKFLDLKAFTESFSSYDPIAQRWLNYGYLYSFTELTIGLLFAASKFLILANIVTVFILSSTTYGVYRKLKSKSKFQCACLGSMFNLPLSNITIAENLFMIAMAIYNLTIYFV